MTEDQHGEIWDALQLGKLVNKHLYAKSGRTDREKKVFKFADETLTKAMKTLGRIAQEETAE